MKQLHSEGIKNPKLPEKAHSGSGQYLKERETRRKWKIKETIKDRNGKGCVVRMTGSAIWKDLIEQKSDCRQETMSDSELLGLI